ncbi:MAG: HEAT repeat domain-containing protein [Deltaproteobacteria bacterium]|nr:HEAT repeat domain-containing protein [Deltaproteobacteria bacterium]
MSDLTSLRKLLKSEDPYEKRNACEAVGESRMEGLIPDMVYLLNDEDLRVKEAALNALTSIGGRPVAEAVAPLLRSQDVSLRNIGIEILGQTGSSALETIASLLEDPDDDVVKFGVDIIADISDKRALEGLLPALMEHKNPNVRASVAVCLGRHRCGSAVPLLIKALGDTEEWVRFSAIEGLGLLEARGALSPLFNVIEKDSGLVREAAFDAVSKIASHEDAIMLLPKGEALIRKGEMFSVASVVELLEKALMPGSNFKPGPGFKDVFYGFLSRVVDESDRQSQLKALKGISTLRVRDGLEKLFQFADSLQEIDEETEAFLVDAMVEISGRGPLPSMLAAELKKKGKNLKLIVRALGGIKSAEAVPLLEGLIHGSAKDEIREIVSSLEAIASPDSSAALLRLLKSSDGHTRKTAARALSRLAGEGAVAPLFEALKAECYQDVMEEITEGLAQIPSEAVREGFSGLISSEKESLREMGARGLGVIGAVEALGSLRKAAADKSPRVRKAGYKSMAMLCSPEAAADIAMGLHDRDVDVRLSVLKGLSGWPWEDVKTALLGALKDENMWVRYHAVLLIGEIADNGCEGIVIDMLEHDDAPVKAASARALESWSMMMRP